MIKKKKQKLLKLEKRKILNEYYLFIYLLFI